LRRGLQALAILAVAAGARTEVAAGDSPVPVVVTSAPSGCKKLGEVQGKHYDMANPRVDWATEDALKQAQKLGATHVVTAASGLRYKTAFFKGIAFRCPAPPASPQGK
jgi:hypothetical protein